METGALKWQTSGPAAPEAVEHLVFDFEVIGEWRRAPEARLEIEQGGRIARGDRLRPRLVPGAQGSVPAAMRIRAEPTEESHP